MIKRYPMNFKYEKIHAVPTNIITGFLGVGKTTAILSLLKAKPSTERWAVLVNEFGDIGIDGGLLKGQCTEEGGVFIREVPGGCMCCAAGLPMQIALNQLLTRSKPQRLLIEPTGLGHPKEVLQVLSADHYRNILDIQKTITLVDARKLSDPRYTSHDTFNQQIDIADVVVGSKQDLYQDAEEDLLIEYIQQRKGSDVKVVFSEHGILDPTLLVGPSNAQRLLIKTNQHDYQSPASVDYESIPECGYIRSENTGEGYRSIGWRFSPEKIFDRKALFTCFTGLCVERLKAVLITNEGVFGYNLVDNLLTEVELDDCFESRIELILNVEPELSLPQNFPLGLLADSTSDG